MVEVAARVPPPPPPPPPAAPPKSQHHSCRPPLGTPPTTHRAHLRLCEQQSVHTCSCGNGPGPGGPAGEGLPPAAGAPAAPARPSQPSRLPLLLCCCAPALLHPTALSRPQPWWQMTVCRVVAAMLSSAAGVLNQTCGGRACCLVTGLSTACPSLVQGFAAAWKQSALWNWKPGSTIPEGLPAPSRQPSRGRQVCQASLGSHRCDARPDPEGCQPARPLPGPQAWLPARGRLCRGEQGSACLPPGVAPFLEGSPELRASGDLLAGSRPPCREPAWGGVASGPAARASASWSMPLDASSSLVMASSAACSFCGISPGMCAAGSC